MGGGRGHVASTTVVLRLQYHSYHQHRQHLTLATITSNIPSLGIEHKKHHHQARPLIQLMIRRYGFLYKSQILKPTITATTIKQFQHFRYHHHHILANGNIKETDMTRWRCKINLTFQSQRSSNLKLVHRGTLHQNLSIISCGSAISSWTRWTALSQASLEGDYHR